MGTATSPVVHLDSRWDECIQPQPDSTAWPNDGVITSIVQAQDINTEASGVALTLAKPKHPAERRAGLRELADHGYIGLAGDTQ
jgi:hypothetical protein